MRLLFHTPKNRRSLWIAIIILLITAGSVKSQEANVGFTTTPQKVVEGMLDLANVGPGDYLIDLGSGDGRIVIAAALRGAVAHGIEINPELIEMSRKNAQSLDIGNRTSFVAEDFFDTDVSMATVLTLYVLESTNIRLRETLLKTMDPGSQVISHRYKMGDWKPDDSAEVDFRMIYKWIIPADFSGIWSWEIEGNKIQMQMDQRYQEITNATINSGHSSLISIRDPKVTGKQITFWMIDQEQDITYRFYGKIVENRITGVLHTYNWENRQTIEAWNAFRK